MELRPDHQLTGKTALKMNNEIPVRISRRTLVSKVWRSIPWHNLIYTEKLRW